MRGRKPAKHVVSRFRAPEIQKEREKERKRRREWKKTCEKEKNIKNKSARPGEGGRKIRALSSSAGAPPSGRSTYTDRFQVRVKWEKNEYTRIDRVCGLREYWRRNEKTEEIILGAQGFTWWQRGLWRTTWYYSLPFTPIHKYHPSLSPSLSRSTLLSVFHSVGLSSAACARDTISKPRKRAGKERERSGETADSPVWGFCYYFAVVLLTLCAGEFTVHRGCGGVRFRACVSLRLSVLHNAKSARVDSSDIYLFKYIHMYIYNVWIHGNRRYSASRGARHADYLFFSPCCFESLTTVFFHSPFSYSKWNISRLFLLS